MATRADLVREVLQDLSALDAVTSEPPAEDKATVEARIPTALAELAEAAEAYIPVPLADDDEVEDAVFEPLAAYMVEVLAPKFGRPRDVIALDAAERRLRRIFHKRRNRGTGRMLSVDPALRRPAHRRF